MKRAILKVLALTMVFGTLASLCGCNSMGGSVDQNALEKEQREREEFNKKNNVPSGN